MRDLSSAEIVRMTRVRPLRMGCAEGGEAAQRLTATASLTLTRN